MFLENNLPKYEKHEGTVDDQESSVRRNIVPQKKASS